VAFVFALLGAGLFPARAIADCHGDNSHGTGAPCEHVGDTKCPHAPEMACPHAADTKCPHAAEMSCPHAAGVPCPQAGNCPYAVEGKCPGPENCPYAAQGKCPYGCGPKGTAACGEKCAHHMRGHGEGPCGMHAVPPSPGLRPKR